MGAAVLVLLFALVGCRGKQSGGEDQPDSSPVDSQSAGSAVASVEEGQSIQAPAVRILLIPYRVNWKSTVGDLHVKSRQSISYDQLSALLGGNVTEGAQVSFVNGK